jgi:hypothetical protein
VSRDSRVSRSQLIVLWSPRIYSRSQPDLCELARVGTESPSTRYKEHLDVLMMQ